MSHSNWFCLKGNSEVLFRKFAVILILIALLSRQVHGSIDEHSKVRRKTSIVVVMADDLGFGDVQYNRLSSRTARNGALTPNMNVLSRSPSAIRFDNFHSASSVCSPTRLSMITGRHPDRDCVSGANTMYDKPGIAYRDQFPFREGIPSIARTAGNMGYRTGFFGKWHIGPLGTRGPDTLGFQKWTASSGNIPTYDPECLRDEAICEASCNRRRSPKLSASQCVREGPQCVSAKTKKECYLGHYGTSALNFSPQWNPDMHTKLQSEKGTGTRTSSKLTRVAIPRKSMSCDFVVNLFETWLKTISAQTPFFAYVFFNEPHHPFIASPAIAKQCMSGQVCTHPQDQLLKETDYFGVVVAIDRALGRVRALLKSRKRFQDTLLIFTSDNGPESAEGDGAGTPLPYRTNKGTVYEGSHRVPALMEWPANIKGNSVVKGLVSSLDFRRTFMDLFRAEGATDDQLRRGNENSTVDGVSFLPMFRNPSGWRRPQPFGICQPIQQTRRFCDTFAYSDGRWKVIGKRMDTLKEFQADRMMLFDVDSDPQERENLADSKPEIYDKLSSQAVAWVQSVASDYYRNCKAKGR